MLALEHDTVDLVDIDLTIGAATCRGLLSREERARAARFRDPRHRERFVVGRASLRLVLGTVLQLWPGEVEIQRGANGKPHLAAAHGSQVRFNISHSGERALLALTVAREVGVDLERSRGNLDVLDIARRFFAPGESAALEALPAEERTEAFFRCWTFKESYLKARGEGLLARLDAFEVALSSRAARVLWSTLDPADVDRWWLLPLDPGAGYQGALAVEGPPPALRRWSAPGALRQAFVT